MDEALYIPLLFHIPCTHPHVVARQPTPDDRHLSWQKKHPQMTRQWYDQPFLAHYIDERVNGSEIIGSDVLQTLPLLSFVLNVN